MMAKYRSRLTIAETGLYDLMHGTSELLKQLADEVVTDSLDPDLPGSRTERVEYAHDAVTYAFTLGAQFAVQRQMEAGRQLAEKMGLKLPTQN